MLFDPPDDGNPFRQTRRRTATTTVQPYASQGIATGEPTPGSFFPQPTPTTTPDPTPAPAPRKAVSTLMEGDPTKLADPSHIAKSPKYQFLSLAPYYGRGQENELLAQLQKDYADYWNGWKFDGRGNFVYGGDPAALNSAWNGATSVDAYGGYNGGGPLRARWGVNEPGMPTGVPAPQTTPFQFPSWMDDGIDPTDLSRLTYNVYLGRDPTQTELGGASAYGLNNPAFWDSLQSIFNSQEASAYRGAGNYVPQVAPPSLAGMDPGSISQGLQLLMGRPAALQGNTQAATNPLTLWLMQMLGLR